MPTVITYLSMNLSNTNHHAAFKVLISVPVILILIFVFFVVVSDIPSMLLATILSWYYTHSSIRGYAHYLVAGIRKRFTQINQQLAPPSPTQTSKTKITCAYRYIATTHDSQKRNSRLCICTLQRLGKAGHQGFPALVGAVGRLEKSLILGGGGGSGPEKPGGGGGPRQGSGETRVR